MNQEAVIQDLQTKDKSDFQDKVSRFVADSMKYSYQEMQTYHPSWEEADLIYRGYRLPDKEDKEAQSKKEPPKIILPISYAQSQVFVSFLLETFMVNGNIYRLKGAGPEDQRFLGGIERELEYQTAHLMFYVRLYNWFLDATKYGVGIVKSCWATETEKVRSVERRVVQPNPFQRFSALFGGQAEPQEVMEEVVRDLIIYEGNRLENVTPFCFYPDPSVPIAKFQEGAYVGHENETTKAALASREGSTYFGIQKIPGHISQATLEMRRHFRVGRDSLFRSIDFKQLPGDGIKTGEAVIHSELEFTMNGRELKKKFDYDLDSRYGKDAPVKMVASTGNVDKVIQFEPLGYLHGRYNYDVIEYSPDHNAFANAGLSETIYNLQEIMTWFLNSHVANVRKAIKNRFIGDPEKFHVEDITNGMEFIRTKSAPGRKLEESIKVLDVTDVTRGHVGDMTALNQMIQLITGINENALGQYSSGRRSATESRNVNSSAAARLKMHGKLAWYAGIEPLGRKLIANTRQLRTREFYARVVGEDIEKYPYEGTIVATAEQIVGGYDFVPYDATMPNDKERQAFHFQELLKVAISNPQSAAALGLNVQKILGHVFELYGVRNFKDFKLTPPEMQQQLQALAVPDAMVEGIRQQGAKEVAGISLAESLRNSGNEKTK